VLQDIGKKALSTRFPKWLCHVFKRQRLV